MLENPLLTNKTQYESKVLDEKLYNLLDKTFIIPKEFKYNIIEVSSDYIARMDLISYNTYGTEKYQDVLCKLNGISNPFELNEGMIIVLPEIAYLDDFYYTENPSEKEESSNEVTHQPIAKGKSEKRKPNEAVIGDKRYKVDSTRKVIIY